MLYMEQKMVVNKKMLQMEEKTCYGAKNNPRSQNEVHKRPMSVLSSVTHYGIELPCLPCTALCGLLCHYVTLHVLMWPWMVLMLLFMAVAVWHH